MISHRFYIDNRLDEQDKRERIADGVAQCFKILMLSGDAINDDLTVDQQRIRVRVAVKKEESPYDMFDNDNLDVYIAAIG